MEQQLPFHQQLRHERQLRGWSQADLASRVGSDVKTVNRWESGKSLPRPYFRQMFCDLFGKNAEELGLVKKAATDSKTIPLLPDSIDQPLTVSLETNIDESTSFPSSRQASTIKFIHRIKIRVDWGEAPQIKGFYGRDKELGTLKQWIEEDRCRIVAVLGMGGIGKTTFAAHLTEQIKDTFEYVFWRSLQNAPPLEHILKNCVQFVSNQQIIHLPDLVNDQITLLIQYLREYRCLLVLDNAESILQPKQRVAQYLEGYENYGTLFQRLGESEHRSCLILTSREKLKEVAYLEGNAPPVRSLHLSGVGHAEGQELLKEKNLFGSLEQWAALVNLYSGNPLALKLVSYSIQGIFEGDIARFLEQEEIAFGDINELIDRQFHRLTVQEQELLYWLAIERDTTSLKTLRENIIQPMLKGALLEALESLRRRFLIEMRGNALFTLQPVILEYLTNRITKQVYEEIIGTEGIAVEILRSHVLLKAQSKDYVRDSQARLILSPVVEQLHSILGTEGIKYKLENMLSSERKVRLKSNSYLAGNVLNFLIFLHYDLREFDFSFSTIRQAYLQNIALPQVNFANARFVSTVFSNTFGNILSVAFSHHSGLFVTGTANGEIWVYQAKDGSPLLTCYGHTDAVYSIVFSSNDRIFVSSSDDQTVRLWDANTGHCLKILYGHTNRVRSVSFSPNNKLVASGSEDGTIRLWDVSSGGCLRTLGEHNNRVWSVAFSSNGKMLVSGSEDTTVRLWNVNTGQCLRTLYGHTGGIRSVAFRSDNAMLASGGDDRTVRIWEANTGRCLKILHGHTNRLLSVTFSPDGHVLASGGEDQSIRLWDTFSGLCLKLLQQHNQGVRSIAFAPDGQTLASGGEDQTVRFWDANTGYRLKTLQGYTNRIRSIAFAPDGEMLASGGESQTIQLWNITTGRCFYRLKDNVKPVRSIVFSPDGRTLAGGGDDQAIRLWDVSSGRCFSVLHGHTNWVWTIAFSPDGRTLASGGEDQVVRLWDVSSGQCFSILQGHTSWVRSVVFNIDGSIIASGSDDQTIRLWEANTGHYLTSLEGHTGRVRSVDFHTDGFTLASGSEDQTIRLWDITTGHCRQIFQGHTNWVRSVIFSPDGQILASSSDDRTIRLWDLNTNRCFQIFHGHTDRIRSLVFSSHGSMLASGSDDGTIKIWNIKEATCIKTLISERPYERMNITGVSGLTEAQRTTLKLLGAIER